MASQAFLEKAYLAYFGRPVDPSGAATYANTSEATVLTSFSSSAESVALYGSTFGYAQINAIYQMLFNRDADVAGANFYLARVANGTSTIAGVALDILNGAQNTDATVITNKIAASRAFTTSLDTISELVGYSGNAAAAAARDFLKTVTTTVPAQTAIDAAIVTTTSVGGASGSTFTLTTGVDSVAGSSGNDTFISDNTAGAGKYTLTVADSVTGGSGVDTLKVYSDGLAGGSTFTPSQITGVENLYINNLAGTGTGVALDVSKVVGLTAVTLDTPYSAVIGGDSADTITLAGQSLTISNVAKAITGTNKVTFTVASTTDTTENITVNGLSQTNNSTKAITVDVTGAKVTSATITATGAASTINLANSTGAAITTLNLLGDKKLTATVSAAESSALKVINASGDTGGVSLDTTGGAKLAAFAFTGGSGNDTLKLKAGDLSLLTSGAQLDGGAGTADVLEVLETSFATADYAALNKAVNFEVLSLAGANTVDASKITAGYGTHYQINGAAETVNNIAAGTIFDLASNGALTVTPAIGASSVVLNIGAATSTGVTTGALSIAGETTVAIASNGDGTGNNVTGALTASDNSTYTITGTNNLIFTGLTAGTAVGSKVDATGFTGKFELGTDATAAGFVITAGTDNVTIGTSGKGDIINTGTGAAVIIASAVETATGSKGDIITFAPGHAASTVIVAPAAAAFVVPTTGNLETIKGYTLGSDILGIAITAAGTSATKTAVIGAAPATDIAAGVTANAKGLVTGGVASATAFLTALATGTGTPTAFSSYTYTDGTDTYVAIAEAAAATKWEVIKLTGVVATQGETITGGLITVA